MTVYNLLLPLATVLMEVGFQNNQKSQNLSFYAFLVPPVFSLIALVSVSRALLWGTMLGTNA